MAASLVSSIIFVLLFIMLSLFVDGNVFAAQMEHRKLGGAKETTTMRRNLEENGRQGSKMATPGSTSPHCGQRNTENEPSQTYPDQATAQRKKPYLSYVGILPKPASDTMTMRRNLKGNGEGPSKIGVRGGNGEGPSKIGVRGGNGKGPSKMGVRGSTSPTAGGKTANVPVQSHPKKVYYSYGALKRNRVPVCKDSNCTGVVRGYSRCEASQRCKRGEP